VDIKCGHCDEPYELAWIREDLALEILEGEYVPGGNEEDNILGRILEILSGRLL